MGEDRRAFAGFADPSENWVKLPKAIYENLDRFETMAEMKVVLYVLRHTWGYGDDWKAISTDEIARGRKRKDGSRIDAGTGMNNQQVRDGTQRAVDHGWLRVWHDASDQGRQVKYYMLARQDVAQTPPGEEVMPTLTGDENHTGGDEDHPWMKIIQGGDENHPSYIDRSLDRSLDRSPDTQLSGEGGENGSVPASGSESGDPFFGQTRTAWYGYNGRRQRAKQDVHAASKVGLSPRDLVALADKLAEIHHLKPLIDAGDDGALSKMQQLAVLLAGSPFGIDTADKIDALYASWRARYNKGMVAPYANSLASYASSLVQDGRLTDGDIDDGPGGSVVADGPRTKAMRERQQQQAALLPALPSGDVEF